jgi:hypothetical protein
MRPTITQGHSSSTDHGLFTPGRSQWRDAPAYFAVREICHDVVASPTVSSSGETPDEQDTGTPLEDAARAEREYVRQRLREELQREPTEEEVDEWLRQHTEGY